MVERPANPNPETGFTITELLVAMAISLLLSAGLIQVFLSARQTYSTNEAMARVQEDGRFTIQHMSAIASLAGHDDPDTSASPGAGLRPATGTGPDSLTIRFEGAGEVGDESILDCLGKPVLRGQIAVNVFSLAAGEISCESRIDSGTTITEVLVGNIDSWRILYGIDDTADPDTAPNRYVSASGVSVAQWPSVCVLRLSLLVRSHSESGADADNRSYDLLDHTHVATGDRRLRKTFRSTVKLRNGTCGLGGSA